MKILNVEDVEMIREGVSDYLTRIVAMKLLRKRTVRKLWSNFLAMRWPWFYWI